MEQDDNLLSKITNTFFISLSVLQYVFIALKFLNIIKWSWFITLLPTLILIIFIVLILFAILCILIITMIMKVKGGVKHD